MNDKDFQDFALTKIIKQFPRPLRNKGNRRGTSRVTLFPKRSVGERVRVRGKKEAFTLAEVLITLGVIGVVAAMTMPALVANHQKKEVVTKLKKVYTSINQAILLTNVEYGSNEYWFKDCGSSNSPTCTGEEVKTWFLETFGKHLQYTNLEVSASQSLLIYFTDGGILRIEPCIYDMHYYTSAKAYKSPIQGKSHFMFNYKPIQRAGTNFEDSKYAIGKGFVPYITYWNGTREGLINTNNMFGCNKTAKAYCGALIQYDGWQISKDYPW